LKINRSELVNQMREVASRFVDQDILSGLGDLITDWAECVEHIKIADETLTEFMDVERVIENALTASRAFHPRC